MRRKLLRFCALLVVLGMGAGVASAADLLAVDRRLYELGYRDDACSGVLDEVMTNALRNFQRANGLGVTGRADDGTVLLLESDSAVSQSAYLTRVAQKYAAETALGAGASGDAVTKLQRALKELGYFAGKCDGAYGEATAEAVRRFQFAHGLPVTGEADGLVLARLDDATSISWQGFLSASVAMAGDEGEQVRMLQRWLRDKGYFDGDCTGRYGEGTQRAVREFQEAAGLAASGDADLETCRALYGNVSALMADVSSLRRGSAGAEAMCRDLAVLGYGAHGNFDMQTELALMQFQWANGLAPTGVANEGTLKQLAAPEAVPAAGFEGGGAEIAHSSDFATAVAHQAMRLLGQESNFDEEFGLIQYVYMKCGVAVSTRAQFALAGTQLSEAAPGDAMVLEFEDGEHCGIAASDAALIYRDADGRILMGYPNAMGAKSVRLYRLEGA